MARMKAVLDTSAESNNDTMAEGKFYFLRIYVYKHFSKEFFKNAFVIIALFCSTKIKQICINKFKSNLNSYTFLFLTSNHDTIGFLVGIFKTILSIYFG